LHWVEIGSPLAIPTLETSLSDEDKYVRYSSAVSLKKLGWNPAGERENSRYLVGLQDWDRVAGIGKLALPALTETLRDKDKNVRISAIRALGIIQDPEADNALIKSVGDPDRAVGGSTCFRKMRSSPIMPAPGA
jgi:HEAT repeat protein